MRTIPARWRNGFTPGALALWLCAVSAQAQPPLTKLAAGIAAYQRHDYAAAISQLKDLDARVPKLADYAGYYRAAAMVESKAQSDITGDLAPVFAAAVVSPLEAKAVLLQAGALTSNGKPADAVRLISDRYESLPQPDADLALATAREAAGDLPQAAIFYQQVYYRYPASDQAQKAAAGIANLRDRLGASFPALSTQMFLLRADRLVEARDYVRARAEYQALIPQLSGAEKDQARVRLGAIDELRGDCAAAYPYLSSLDVSVPEADAERLYYLAECARRTNNEAGMMDAVRRLNAQHERSQWRFKALLSAANRFLVANRPADYEPLYAAAGKSFPDEPRAAAAHWKYVWAGYIRRQSDAADRLREHLKLFAASPTAAGALYFLGRLSEDRSDPAAARAYYTKLAGTFPNYYYGLLAQRRLADPPLSAAGSSPSAAEFLSTVSWPDPHYGNAIQPTAETELRIERARLLRSAGLSDLADAELRFGARNKGQPVLLAIDMARSSSSAYQGLRAMKSLVPDGLAMPIDGAPKDYWQLLFPLPYKDDLMSNAKSRGLDPSMVAALIRQESEFNPQALSRAKAYGLTQVRPATGRTLAHKAGMRSFSSRMLFQPSTNLRLGTLYLRMLLDQFNGSWEETLAAYNAGKSRVDDWHTWATFREPAEFVESIPFTETREYVQAVLRNAELYRRIYGDKLAAP